MDVELLVVPDCPNEAPARELLRTALDDVGLTDVAFTTTVIDTQQLAERRAFTGSPKILINGADPFAEPGREAALACRTYSHPQGTAGIPDLRLVRQALKRAAATSAYELARSPTQDRPRGTQDVATEHTCGAALTSVPAIRLPA